MTEAVPDDVKAPHPTSRPAVERHLDYALELIRAGRRPTLDMLVAENGGSRTTAQQALNSLWSEHLPALLLEADSESSLPDSVRSALVAVWSQALREAQEIASAALAEDRAAVESAKVTIEAQADALVSEREAVELAAQEAERQVRDALAELEKEREARQLAQQDALDARERAESLGAQLAKSDRALADATQALAKLEALRKQEASDAKLALERAEAAAEKALAAARADAATMRADMVQAHEQALAALKDAYVDSEARLRVEIDAHKTRAKQVERECESLRQHNADQMARIAELEVAVAKAKTSRRPWKRTTTGPRTRRLR